MITVEQLCDIESIKNLRNLYCHFFDGQFPEEMAALFTEDAICEFGPDYGGDWVGREQIHKNFADWMKKEGPQYGVMHSVTNPWIRMIDDETANGRWYLHDLRTTEGFENPLILYGIYDDVYKKIDGEWLIHQTRIDFLWPKRYIMEPRDISYRA
ncbi:MAG: nuclear transport factor 2 family protein [Gammaproteobacteria bacterium]|nr:nuclear transport factor 2 family protein [Gammaproteobacteria bacterium]MBT4491706.1 nuclear transport factor 2 family protein [Gammaproteobacteria bacterium]MBT7369474.1 nuclear transport factor 2 family protein [Gammaproteobacteria bacterium]